MELETLSTQEQFDELIEQGDKLKIQDFLNAQNISDVANSSWKMRIMNRRSFRVCLLIAPQAHLRFLISPCKSELFNRSPNKNC
jgi:hypothetical protein